MARHQLSGIDDSAKSRAVLLLNRRTGVRIDQASFDQRLHLSQNKRKGAGEASASTGSKPKPKG
jgi:hypothetical protein